MLLSAVLVVEDHTPIRDAIGRAVLRHCYSVFSASVGIVALVIVPDSAHDLIILDIYLPVLDGRRFVEAYREMSGPHAPILIITAMGHAAQRAAALEAAAHLDKPFTPTELLARVKALIGPPVFRS